jgi:hypothetical protein
MNGQDHYKVQGDLKKSEWGETSADINREKSNKQAHCI